MKKSILLSTNIHFGPHGLVFGLVHDLSCDLCLLGRLHLTWMARTAPLFTLFSVELELCPKVEWSFLYISICVSLLFKMVCLCV